jgi:enoyl-CoA hydratase
VNENPFEPDLLIERRGAVRIVTFSRPESLNSVALGSSHGLADLWAHLAEDTEARAFVLTGAGRAFSAGCDIVMFRRIQEDFVERARLIEEALKIFMQLIEFPLPMVAAVDGPAVGLGCTPDVRSDLVFVAESAFLQEPDVSIGLTVGDRWAPCRLLTMSCVHALELPYFSDRPTAPQAVDLMLANAVTPDGGALDKAFEVAERLAALPPQALQSTKRAINLHVARGASAFLDNSLTAEFQPYDAPEHRAAIKSFMKRRDPRARRRPLGTSTARCWRTNRPPTQGVDRSTDCHMIQAVWQ